MAEQIYSIGYILNKIFAANDDLDVKIETIGDVINAAYSEDLESIRINITNPEDLPGGGSGEFDHNLTTNKQGGDISNFYHLGLNQYNSISINKFDAVVDPTVDDDSINSGGNGEFSVGSVWINISSNEFFICVNDSIGSAVWKSFDPYLVKANVIDISENTILTESQNNSIISLKPVDSDITLTLPNPTLENEGVRYFIFTEDITSGSVSISTQDNSFIGNLQVHVLDSKNQSLRVVSHEGSHYEILLDSRVFTNVNELSAGLQYPKPSVLDNGDGSLTIGDVKANLYKTSNYNGGIKSFDISESTLTLTDNSVNYIIVNYNSGNPIYQVTTDVSIINESDIIPVITSFREGLSITKIDWDSLGVGLSNKLHARFVKTQRFARESGLNLSEKNIREISISSGKVWHGAVSMSLDAVDSAIDTWCFYYHLNGSFVKDTNTTQYNNSQYDDGTNLVALANNKYTVNWIFRSETDSKKACYLLGSSEYDKLADAEASQLPAIPANVRALGILVGRVIVKQGENTGIIQSAFDVIFSSSGIIDTTELAFIYDINSTLTDVNQTATLNTNNITLTLPFNPSIGREIRINNDSGGLCFINGNGNLIYDSLVFNIYDGESVILIYNSNGKWNII